MAARVGRRGGQGVTEVVLAVETQPTGRRSRPAAERAS